MPSRYEREIEEILNRMEESEPRRGFGDRIRPMQRPPSHTHSLPRLHISLVETLILLSIFFTLLATGIAYFNGVADIVTGIIGLVALILFVVALVVGWRGRFRPKRSAHWRGSTTAEVTPLRRNPISALVTRFRVMRLRKQYRRAQREHEDP